HHGAGDGHNTELVVCVICIESAVRDEFSPGVVVTPGPQIGRMHATGSITESVEQLSLVTEARPSPVFHPDLVEFIEGIGVDCCGGPTRKWTATAWNVHRTAIPGVALRRREAKIVAGFTLERRSDENLRDAEFVRHLLVAALVDGLHQLSGNKIDVRLARDLHTREQRIIFVLKAVKGMLHNVLPLVSCR